MSTEKDSITIEMPGTLGGAKIVFPEDRMKQQSNELLMSMLGRQELVDQWWCSPNKGFDMAHPADVDPKKVLEYLMAHAYGGW